VKNNIAINLMCLKDDCKYYWEDLSHPKYSRKDNYNQ